MSPGAGFFVVDWFTSYLPPPSPHPANHSSPHPSPYSCGLFNSQAFEGEQKSVWPFLCVLCFRKRTVCRLAVDCRLTFKAKTAEDHIMTENSFFFFFQIISNNLKQIRFTVKDTLMFGEDRQKMKFNEPSRQKLERRIPGSRRSLQGYILILQA